MPNTTSGTATFDKTFAIDDIIEESFQRIGFDNITGYQMKSARRSLNIMFQEWGNRGLHYWEIDETNIDLVEGQAEYHFFRSAADDTSDSNRAQATTNQVASTIFGIDDVYSRPKKIADIAKHFSMPMENVKKQKQRLIARVQSNMLAMKELAYFVAIHNIKSSSEVHNFAEKHLEIYRD